MSVRFTKLIQRLRNIVEMKNLRNFIYGTSITATLAVTSSFGIQTNQNTPCLCAFFMLLLTDKTLNDTDRIEELIREINVYHKITEQTELSCSRNRKKNTQ